MPERKRLGEILVELQVLTPAEVERVLEALRRRRDRTKFGHMARDLGLLNEEHILAALAVQMQMFPDIADLGLNRLLQRLQEPVPLTARKRARRLSDPALRRFPPGDIQSRFPKGKENG
jgi:hypothetical protein